jgi:predicted component of type VI protein secretion system
LGRSLSPSERGSNEELDLPLKQQRKGARNGPPSYRDVKLQERLQNAIGVNAQREIEQAVQTAMQQTKPGSEALIAKMTLEIPAIA